MEHTVIEEDNTAGASQLLDQLDTLRVILPFYVYIVGECLVFGRAVEQLESSSVESRGILLSTKILYYHFFLLTGPIPFSFTGGKVSVDMCVCPNTLGWRYKKAKLGSGCGSHFLGWSLRRELRPSTAFIREIHMR